MAPLAGADSGAEQLRLTHTSLAETGRPLLRLTSVTWGQAMDRRSFRSVVVLAMLTPVSACVVPPGGYASQYPTAQPGYPPAVYPAPAYQGPAYQTPTYQPPPYQPAYYPPPAPAPSYPDDQYTYIDGIPYAEYSGQQEVVVFDSGLGWGFYDPSRHWHPAPERWRNDFDHRYPGGHGYNPPPPRDFGARPGFSPGITPGGRPPDPAIRPGTFQEPRGQRAPEPPPSRPGVFRPSEPPAGRQGGEPPGGHPGFAPRGEEQRVNAPQPPRPQAPPPPQQHAAPPSPQPHGGGFPACGQAGAPRC